MKHLLLSLTVGFTVAISALVRAQSPQPESSATDTDWLGYDGGYDATRFSPLTQIDTKNVAQLKEVARFQIPETLSFQCGPVVVGGSMFITTVTSTYAIDARTGKEHWVRTIKPSTHMIGTPVRGVAYADGRCFAVRWMATFSVSMPKPET
jgi:alcohol dehydrogenase (cytochrome c)